MGSISFRGLKAAVTAAILLSLITIALTCIVPGLIIDRVYSECKEHISNAIEYAVTERNELAHIEVEYIVREIKKAERELCLYYDHQDIMELSRSAFTAFDLSETDDPAQLIAELNNIQKCFEFLIHLNDISIYNIF